MSMEKHDPLYAAYIRILEAELIPATGCTEPIAIAYAAAKARAVLGTLPESCLVEASGNIIKNVKSVVVPNTGHMRGIPAAASAGIVAGDADAQLQVISRVSPEAREQIKVYCDTHTIQVVPAHNGKVFYIAITVKAGDSSARAAAAPRLPLPARHEPPGPGQRPPSFDHSTVPRRKTKAPPGSVPGSAFLFFSYFMPSRGRRYCPV